VTVEQSRRWVGGASFVLAAVALTLAVVAIVGELAIVGGLSQEEQQQTFSAIHCHGVIEGWTGRLFFVVVPLLGLLAMLLGALALPGVRWRAVVASCVPLALVLGFGLVFNFLHPNEAQDWPIFHDVCSKA
jgi:hypothetical protein